MPDKTGELRFWPGMPPADGGYPGFNPRTEKGEGIICEFDVAVTMRDGLKIYVDVFRPEKEGEYPALVSWSPYGKHGRTKYAWFHRCGVCDADLSRYCIFEAPDPGYWCPNGYTIINVDSRGAWNSEGDLTFMTGQEAEDCYDLIEWAATQDWSNGKVGMLGASYLAWSQWRVAALNPPHLAAISPWEGVSDFYRELAYHGGIPETDFLPGLKTFMSFTTTRVEDIVEISREHALFDDYWASKNANLSKITVPAFIVASWSDQGLHTRGTLEGFKKISSNDKWLMVHGRKKWQSFYQYVDRQKQFFDWFLKGSDSEIKYWPKVILEIRERFYWGNFRAENEWPLARTQYTELYLDGADGKMGRSPFAREARVRYNVNDITDKTQNARFEFQFDEKTELTGHMKLKLWVSAEGSDDMDLFVALEKIDRSGRFVPFPFFSVFEDGPVALGWLRVSHRELDVKKSMPYQPVLKHERILKLTPGEIVPVEIEILPSSTLFEAGEKLRVVVQGTDIYNHPGGWPTNAHTETVNKGNHVIYTGDGYDSYLLVPVIPTD